MSCTAFRPAAPSAPSPRAARLRDALSKRVAFPPTTAFASEAAHARAAMAAGMARCTALLRRSLSKPAQQPCDDSAAARPHREIAPRETGAPLTYDDITRIDDEFQQACRDIDRQADAAEQARVANNEWPYERIVSTLLDALREAHGNGDTLTASDIRRTQGLPMMLIQVGWPEAIRRFNAELAETRH